MTTTFNSKAIEPSCAAAILTYYSRDKNWHLTLAVSQLGAASKAPIIPFDVQFMKVRYNADDLATYIASNILPYVSPEKILQEILGGVWKQRSKADLELDELLASLGDDDPVSESRLEELAEALPDQENGYLEIDEWSLYGLFSMLGRTQADMRVTAGNIAAMASVVELLANKLGEQLPPEMAEIRCFAIGAIEHAKTNALRMRDIIDALSHRANINPDQAVPLDIFSNVPA